MFRLSKPITEQITGDIALCYISEMSFQNCSSSYPSTALDFKVLLAEEFPVSCYLLLCGMVGSVNTDSRWQGWMWCKALRFSGASEPRSVGKMRFQTTYSQETWLFVSGFGKIHTHK